MEESADVLMPGIDATKPSVARMYDYYLGGKDNYRVDREAVAKIAAAMPEIRVLAQENRAFLRRAVRFLTRQGIRQFIDIGAGLPTVGNTHEIAQEIAPDARVVYVDNDPVVHVHGQALLAANENTTVVMADMRRPEDVLGHPETTRLIDFDRPVGVMLIAMTHFLTLDEGPQVLGRLRDVMAPGSHIAATHVTGDGQSAATVDQIEGVYATTPTPIYFRPHDQVARFFAGFELVEPGLVTVDRWRPDPSDPAPAATRWLYGGVARKA